MLRQSLIQATTVCDRSVKRSSSCQERSQRRCKRDVRGTCHLTVRKKIHCHHHRVHMSPRDSCLLNYNIIKIESHEGCSQTLARHWTRSQSIHPENTLSITYPDMTEFTYPDACLHHSTFVAQCIVTYFLQVCHAHIPAAQLELTPSTTNRSPH